ncbi:hypothetical protein [Phytopseudomonas punonensis]|uniref:Uncharacterized protein n=1 Tax=Phytopseudomonas punonensis TaxID=1220495 RepID=A0A1M7NSC3_9GAMM|nr:hypothetical protein [Pseudomonas punonensis]SHN06801.1 hypothetical protein SAMN05216288_0458 [Pseudomonas punonensis]
MRRYLFIAALGFVGGYAWGNADGFAYAVRMAPVAGQFSPY